MLSFVWIGYRALSIAAAKISIATPRGNHDDSWSARAGRLSARWLSQSTETSATTLADENAVLVNGFVEPIVKELPTEYAFEMNRLIECRWNGRWPADGSPPPVRASPASSLVPLP